MADAMLRLQSQERRNNQKQSRWPKECHAELHGHVPTRPLYTPGGPELSAWKRDDRQPQTNQKWLPFLNIAQLHMPETRQKRSSITAYDNGIAKVHSIANSLAWKDTHNAKSSTLTLRASRVTWTSGYNRQLKTNSNQTVYEALVQPVQHKLPININLAF